MLTFDPFQCNVEGVLARLGMSYLASKSFQEWFVLGGEKIIDHEMFWQAYKVNRNQYYLDSRASSMVLLVLS